ncbi:208_t:CDS:2 [Funneliformis caledonium]|uniref:F-box only protein 9 n=1 Tax=Funneliformis caledonium TaxID=1117310 RepID=A0A9N9B0F9_9GLOM|nr:208_t:CDS:2 [Funneliformis caledonium]
MSTDTNELERFREKWKAEISRLNKKDAQSKTISNVSVSSTLVDAKKVQPLEDITEIGTSSTFESTKPVPDPKAPKHKALEIYVKAVTNEREGNLNEALINYRQALKLDPTVENSYKKQLYSVVNDKKTESSNFFVKHLEELPQFPHVFIGEDYEIGRFGTKSSAPKSKEDNNISNLITSFRNLQLGLLPLNPNKRIDIAKLPNELIVCILHQLIARGDVTSLERFALACKKFFLLSREVSLWRYLCEKAYRNNYLSLDASNSLLEEYVKLYYHSDWRKMYIERPRIRLDGIYIAICNYLRPGSSENAWNRPIHLVTYYRYIRFYSDGSCIALMTTNEPINVVKNFGPNCKSKNFMKGKWELSDDHILMIRAKDYGLPKFTFYSTFDLKSTHRGRHNKLTWIGKK